ncbi:MAG: response regulator [Lachnospiraceae bacterium]
MLETDDKNQVMQEYNVLMTSLHVSVSKHYMNEHFTLVWANNYFYNMIGYTKEEFATKYHNRGDRFYEDAIEEWKKICESLYYAVERGAPRYECTCRLPRKDKPSIWIHLVGIFTQESIAGNPVIYQAFTDITDQMELQQQLEEHSAMLYNALQMAERVNEAKSDFLSRMSHDIRTPMNVIMGMIRLTRESIEDTSYALNCLDKVETSAQYLLSLINDILDMSKIESGKMILHRNSFDFVAFIQDIKIIIGQQAQEKQQTFQVIVAHNMEDRYYGDKVKLNQIVMNLLSNAVKFTQEGGRIEFFITEVRRNKTSVELLFIVKDNGIGIDTGMIDKIFDPFERMESSDMESTGAEQSGSGLGLAIASNYAHMMNGNVRVQSVRGDGSKFSAYVWLELDHALCNEQQQQQPLFEGYTALIVDHDPIICTQLSLNLWDCKVKSNWVLTAQDAMARLTKSKTPKVQLIIIEWEMEEVEPIDLIGQIRKLFGNDVKIVVESTADREAFSLLEIDSMIDYFLQKPCFQSTICMMLSQLTEGREPEIPIPEEQIELQLFRGERVLLVEDNDLNREIAQTLLEQKNLVVEIAVNGLDAVEQFRNHKSGYYKVILMDIRMPVMSGLEAATTIRASKQADAESIPIYAMSANAFMEDVQKSLEAGMNGHISKPINVDEMYRILLEAIYQS